MKTIAVFVLSTNHVFPDHPEMPERFAQIKRDRSDVTWLDALPASREAITRVHEAELIDGIALVCERSAPGIIDYAPTYVTRTSYDDALLAAGGTIVCTRAVVRGEARNAFAIVRPPGHHAEPDKAMGFCLFNNIAIAAQEALALGLQRVAIIDYDAHHGNGTQAAAWAEPRIAFLSSHQEGIYPGSGFIEDAPHAQGRIVNVPLPAYAGDTCFTSIADEIYIPFVKRFKPEMIFVSAGFDSHWDDPLTSLGLSSAGFYMLSQRLVALAEEYCNGRIVFVLEGGYKPRNVAKGVEAVFSALTGSGWNDPGDASPHREPNIASRIEAVRKWNGL
jgi:acetoin utilization deacetylase AcuC-like enzyme